MDTNVQDTLRQYLQALGEPSRADILFELEEAGELTATQLAARLGLTVGNVYHHLRVLSRMGVLSPPRVVPGPTYVEKYYRLHPDIAAAVSDPNWVDTIQPTVDAAVRQAFWVAFLAHAGHLLLRASARYAEMPTENWDALIYQRQLGMLSVRTLHSAQFEHNLAQTRALLRSSADPASDKAPPHLFLIAALPDFHHPNADKEPGV